jgi:PAS domain S-box-containing protein
MAPQDQPPGDKLQTLEEQLKNLRAEHLELQRRYEEQTVLSQTWLEQRTGEMEREARELRKAQTLQSAFYRISESATAGMPFYDFLKSVHALLGELIYAKNCYVALYNRQRNTLDFPYYVDEKDGAVMQSTDVPYRDGLTEHVLRTGIPQLIDADRFVALRAQGYLSEASGDLSFMTWLGVPMHIHGTIAGVLVVQSYEAGVIYTQADVEILSFVSNHFSSAIERYQAIDALKSSERRYRSVIENVGVGVVVVQDGRMVFANPSLVGIIGHPLEYLLSQPFTATIHPDDVAEVVERHQKRLRGEPVPKEYGFRIITASGEIRALELSAGMIDWNHRVATLMFVVDATERQKTAQAQRLALQKQIELTDMKSRFISMASHEFRTPLAAIHGSVELLKHYEDRMPPDKKRATLLKIDDAVDRMVHMLENVMLIGRSDSVQMEFRPRALAITPFCQGLLDELRGTAAVHFDALKWAIELPSQDACFELDDALIRNIVGNLLSNAMKYTPDGELVEFIIREGQAGELHISVADQGIGIPEQDLDQLFESFHRASNVGTIAGTGLGLSIVKEAVSHHGGRITVKSTVGQGSCFTVVLPARRCLEDGRTP